MIHLLLLAVLLCGALGSPGVVINEYVTLVDVAHQDAAFPTAAALAFNTTTLPDLATEELMYTVTLDSGEVVAQDKFTMAGLEGPLLILVNSPVSGSQNLNLNIAFSATSSNSVASATGYAWIIPGGYTLFPLFVIIILAALSRNVVFSLFCGIFSASFIQTEYSFLGGFRTSFEVYIVDAMADADHVYVILFSVFLGGLVANIQRSGGATGLAESLSKFASTPVLGQLVTYLLGWLIFFDDYVNTLVVGNTMRPITDKLKVSRQKLAFVVDATAAPIASIMPISAWIAFEVGLINTEIENIMKTGAPFEELGYETRAFSTFLLTIVSRFYPICMLAFQLTLILTGCEFGPMLNYERKARFDITRDMVRDATFEQEGGPTESEQEHEDDMEVKPRKDTPRMWYNSVFPIITLIIFVVVALVELGKEATIDNGEELVAWIIFGNADSYTALLLGGISASIVGWIWYGFQFVEEGQIVVFPFNAAARRYIFGCTGKCFSRKDKVNGFRPLMTFRDMTHSWVQGVTNLTPAVVVLILSWGCGASLNNLGAGRYFSSALEGSISAGALPSVTFVIAALVALATGTSWGTMGILFPLIMPAAYKIAPGDLPIWYGTISSILAGSVFGDHCSPISDTTVLSAIATRCSLESHVWSQMPYSVFVVFFTLLLGDLPTGFGAYSDGAGLAITLIVVCAFALIFAVPVSSPTGAIDPMNWVGIWVRSWMSKTSHTMDPVYRTGQIVAARCADDETQFPCGGSIHHLLRLESLFGVKGQANVDTELTEEREMQEDGQGPHPVAEIVVMDDEVELAKKEKSAGASLTVI